MNIKFLVASIAGIGTIGGATLGGYYFFKKEQKKTNPTISSPVISEKNTPQTTTPVTQVSAR